jgi:hypothetical protein
MAILLNHLPVIPPPVIYDRPNQSLGFLSSPGHTYRTLVSGNLDGWQPLGTPQTGTGGPMTIPAPKGGEARFFRIEVVRP